MLLRVVVFYLIWTLAAIVTHYTYRRIPVSAVATPPALV
jgi:hypothetical protein